jgi:hypothetical protein
MRPTQKALDNKYEFSDHLSLFFVRARPQIQSGTQSHWSLALCGEPALARLNLSAATCVTSRGMGRPLYAVPYGLSTDLDHVRLLPFQEVIGLLVAGKDQDFAESLDIDHPAGPAIEHDPPIPKSCIAAEAHPIGQTLDGLENWRSRASARDFLDSVISLFAAFVLGAAESR